ncbi:MAG: histidine--tRNA ligase [Smithella sp.]
MEKITVIKGFKDILPEDTPRWVKLESTARNVFSSFGFREIRIPILEKTELFKRSIGETTDIVEKEMYTFRDRGEEMLTLRPEATAGIIRAYIEHNMLSFEPVTRLFTIGPMFRRERPQKGRFRQFHQINVELFGDDKPQSDAEVILMLIHFLKTAGLKELSLEINSLGCRKCRPAFSKAVVDYLKGSEEELCPDCQRRIVRNPLRVFDCKVENCGLIIAKAPRILEYLCNECKEHFDVVKSFLNDLNIKYSVNSTMVRGLDYYIRTAFEVKSGSLGAQNSVAGGGRYDGLVSDLGGPEVAGIGFGVGMERILASIPASENNFYKTDLFIAALGQQAQLIGFKLASDLRQAGIVTAMDYSNKSLKSQMKRADKLNSSYTLILGDKEIEDKQVELRNMDTKIQQSLPLDDLQEKLINIINANAC